MADPFLALSQAPSQPMTKMLLGISRGRQPSELQLLDSAWERFAQSVWSAADKARLAWVEAFVTHLGAPHVTSAAAGGVIVHRIAFGPQKPSVTVTAEIAETLRDGGLINRHVVFVSGPARCRIPVEAPPGVAVVLHPSSSNRLEPGEHDGWAALERPLRQIPVADLCAAIDRAAPSAATWPASDAAWHTLWNFARELRSRPGTSIDPAVFHLVAHPNVRQVSFAVTERGCMVPRRWSLGPLVCLDAEGDRRLLEEVIVQREPDDELTATVLNPSTGRCEAVPCESTLHVEQRLTTWAFMPGALPVDDTTPETTLSPGLVTDEHARSDADRSLLVA